MAKNFATRADVVSKLVEKHPELKKSQLEQIVADVNPTIAGLVKSGKFDGYRDMGYLTLEVRDVPQRTHKNPKNGEEIVKEAHQKVKAKVGAKFGL